MRIRIATYPPIPALKAWFGVEDHTNTGYTVLDLKKSLSLHLDVLQQLGSRHLLLELEGFELLDESLCYQVLREGDLISWVIYIAKHLSCSDVIPPASS